jgi:ABC-type transport system substrate-binding protein
VIAVAGIAVISIGLAAGIGSLGQPNSPSPSEEAGGSGDEEEVPGNPGGELVDLALFARGAPAHIDPALTTTLAGAQVANALYDTLTEVDAADPDSPRILPQVAESYDVQDGGSTWTFRIRDGLRFSNGEAVLPSSFVRGWERATDPELVTPAASAFAYIDGGTEKLEGSADTIAGLAADDDRMTLVVQLDEANTGFDAVVGQHLFAPMPSAVDDLPDQSQWENTVMVGNGPFVMERQRTTDGIVLVRNPMWDGTIYDAGLRLPSQAFLERLTIRASADPDAAYEAFVAGDGKVAPVGFAQQREARDRFGNTFEVPFYSSFHLQLGWDDPDVGGPQNQLLREAMMQAIDRAAVNQAEFLGTALVADGITPPGVPGYAEGACSRCVYDPEQARADVAEWRGQGNELDRPLRVQSPAEPGSSDPAAAAIVENLTEVGLDAVEEPLGQEAYFERLAAGDCQICIVATFAPYLSYDAILSDNFHSSASPARNVGGFTDGTFDNLIEDARATMSVAERHETFRAAESRLLDDEIAVIPLSWYAHPYIYADDVATFPVSNLGRIVWEAVSLENP